MMTLPALSSRVIRPINMLFHIRWLQPLNAILLKRLNPRLELGLLQVVVVNRSDAWNTSTRITTASTVHERSTDAAEAVFHIVASCDGVLLPEACELVFTAEMLHVSIFDDKVGGEHAEEVGVSKEVRVRWWCWSSADYRELVVPRSDLAAVSAVADECVN
jgi:hypothetical protein